VSDRYFTNPSALATIRANAESQRHRAGWKQAVFWPYGDAEMILALVDALEEAQATIKSFEKDMEREMRW
jgi:hypothetical protein